MVSMVAVTDRYLDAYLAEHLPELLQRKGPDILRPGETWHVTVQLSGWSSTGDGMLLVLEAMRERGWHATLGHGKNYYAEFTSLDCTIVEIADSLPRAVAEAAKAALEAF